MVGPVCRICHNEQILQQRERVKVVRKYCAGCKDFADASGFKRTFVGHQPIDLCEICSDNMFTCPTCRSVVQKSEVVKGQCKSCDAHYRHIMSKIKVKGAKVGCIHCLGTFEATEMIDDVCVYCIVVSPDLTGQPALFEALRKKVKENKNISEKIKKLIVQIHKTG